MPKARPQLRGLRWLLLVLAAAWPALWLFVPYGLSPAGFNRVGSDLVSDTYRGFLGVVLHVPHARTLEHPATILAACVFVATLVAIVLVRALARRLDPAGHASEALRWSTRTWACMFAWCIPTLVAFGACIAIAPEKPGWLHVVAVGLALLAFLAPILVCLRSDIVARENPPRLWAPRWPGIGTIVVTVAFLIVSGLLDAIQAVVANAGWGVVPVEIVLWLLGLPLAAAFLIAWQYRWGPRPLLANRAIWLRPTRLRALAALDLLLGGAVALLFAAPVLVLAGFNTFIAPQIDEMVGHTHTLPTRVFEWYWQAGVFVGGSWWLLAGVGSWIYWSPAARASWLVSRADGGGDDVIRAVPRK